MNMPRRSKGEGSIFYRKDRKQWVAQLKLEGSKYKTRSAKTRAQARELLRQMQREQEQGTLATGQKQTVKHYLEYWLEVYGPHLRLNSRRLYRQLLDIHLLPVLGHVSLRNLSSQQIDELYAIRHKDGYAVETVRAIHRMLHKALQNAVKWRLLAANPCNNVNQPHPVKHEIHPLTKEQAIQLLQAAKGDRFEALLTLAVATGMRRGELLALRWADIDVEEGSLWVRRTINRVGKHGLVESDPKTESSKRKILLPRFVLTALIQHRAWQAEVRAKAEEDWQERDIVFSNYRGGFIEPADLGKRFKQLLKVADLPDMRFHDLRHSAATILLGMGVPVKLVQELLGHSHFAMTMDRYSHVLPSMQRGMMDQLDNYFSEL
jgi:integrase